MGGLELVSIYKFNDSIQQFDDCVIHDENGNSPIFSYLNENILKGDICGKFWYSYKPSIPKTNEDIPWVCFFNEALQKQIIFSYQNTFPKGLLVYKLEIDGSDHFFAMTFGLGGDKLLDKNKIISDFGLKVAVNICDSKSIKSIQTSKASSTTIRSETQILKGAELRLFGYDFNDEFFKKVICKADSKYDYISDVSGGESVQIKFSKDNPLTWTNLAKITRELYKLYRSNKYKNSGFKCVDNWSFVKSEDEKNILDKELLEYLNNQKLEKIYFSPPEMLDIMKSQFQYGNSKKFYNELNINDYLLYKKNVIKSVSVLKNDYVYLYNKDLNDENTTKFRIYNCIVAELTHDNKDTYILFEGKWRKIDKDFMSSVSSYLFKNNIEFDSDCLKIELKNTLKDSNNEYIESAFNENCVRNSQNLLLMDKSKNIIAGKRIYELCDILSSRGELIHVKKYSGGSSSLSHLFVQVCFYSEAIISDDSARTSMFEFIKKTILDHDSVNYGKEESSFIDIINKSNSSNSNKLTVVLCILSTSSIKLKELPFMVLYEIKQIDSYLKSHFNFKVKYINRVFGEKKK